jgi:hypothetical protein
VLAEAHLLRLDARLAGAATDLELAGLGLDDEALWSASKVLVTVESAARLAGEPVVSAAARTAVDTADKALVTGCMSETSEDPRGSGTIGGGM